MILRALLAIMSLTLGVSADDGVRFYVFEETKTDTLHYEHVLDMTVYDFEDPWVRFYTEYRVYGCRQPTFSYTHERFKADISRQQLQQLRTSLAGVARKSLEFKPRTVSQAGWTHGWLDLGGKNNSINLPTQGMEYVELRTRVTQFLESVVPSTKRKTTKFELQGETVPAKEVTFADLLKTPEKFDQKRIRLRGYWHREFENSNFGPRKGADYKESIGLGDPSTFADAKQIQNVNDTDIVAEGTFELWPGGDMPSGRGVLTRLTLLKKTKP
jgi:hypothetical protein